MIGKIKELYNYRTMISSLVSRDLKSRYSRSILGVLWNFLNPFLQLLIYTTVFSQIMKNGIEDYYMFLFVALIPWIFFSTCLSGGASCVLIQGDMVKKIFFPREVIPISYVTSQFVNLLLCFVVIFAAKIWEGCIFNPLALLCLPLVMIVEYILTIGFTMVLCALNVFFRDIQHIMGIVVMAWQFLTPVMYPIDMVPEEIQWIFDINPMTSVITCYRDILYYGDVPSLDSLHLAIIVGILTLAIGWSVFDKLQRKFAEVL